MTHQHSQEQPPVSDRRVFDNEIQSPIGRAIFTLMFKASMPVGYGTIGFGFAEAVAQNQDKSGLIGAAVGGVIGSVHTATYKLK